MNHTCLLFVPFCFLVASREAPTQTKIANLPSHLSAAEQPVEFVANAGTQPSRHQESGQANKHQLPEVLVNPDWLVQHIADPDVRLIGLGQTREQYNEAHIPGEVFVDWKTEITDPAQPDRYTLLPQAQLEALLGRLGITPDTTIVVSDNLSSRLSARMFWTLKHYGHEKIRLLDGGRKAWIQSGHSFEKEIPQIKPTIYKVARVVTGNQTDAATVMAHLDDQQTCLIDGRPAEQFSGEQPGKAFHTGKEHKRRGHILNAQNIAWTENFNEDGTFKSPDELRQLYSRAGATDDKLVITYCNEGLHAAPPWFVLTEILGYPDVKLYDESMVEWANRDDTPMEESKAKH